jgi:hypothetical protein
MQPKTYVSSSSDNNSNVTLLVGGVAGLAAAALLAAGLTANKANVAAGATWQHCALSSLRSSVHVLILSSLRPCASEQTGAVMQLLKAGVLHAVDTVYADAGKYQSLSYYKNLK